MIKLSGTSRRARKWLWHHVREYSILVECESCIRAVGCVQSGDGGAEASQYEKRLYNKLLSGYARHVRPVQHDSDPVQVRVAFSLVEVLSIDENTGQLSVKAWITMASPRHFSPLHGTSNNSAPPCHITPWWLGSLVVRTTGSQLGGCEFDSRPPLCQVTTCVRGPCPQPVNTSVILDNCLHGP